jgi:concentrative nucleoside transporter, CNT family
LFQQAIALFVLKTDAGFKIFKWLSFLATDFLEESRVGAIFFFDEDTVVDRGWFFTGVLSAIIFFVAFVQMMYYLGVMQWIVKHL